MYGDCLDSCQNGTGFVFEKELRERLLVVCNLEACILRSAFLRPAFLRSAFFRMKRSIPDQNTNRFCRQDQETMQDGRRAGRPSNGTFSLDGSASFGCRMPNAEIGTPVQFWQESMSFPCWRGSCQTRISKGDGRTAGSDGSRPAVHDRGTFRGAFRSAFRSMRAVAFASGRKRAARRWTTRDVAPCP